MLNSKKFYFPNVRNVTGTYVESLLVLDLATANIGDSADSTSDIGDFSIAEYNVLSDGNVVTFREVDPSKGLPELETIVGRLNVDKSPTGLNRISWLSQDNVMNTDKTKVIRTNQGRVEFTSSNMATDEERRAALNRMLFILMKPEVQDMIVSLSPILI